MERLILVTGAIVLIICILNLLHVIFGEILSETFMGLIGIIGFVSMTVFLQAQYRMNDKKIDV